MLVTRLTTICPETNFNLEMVRLSFANLALAVTKPWLTPDGCVTTAWNENYAGNISFIFARSYPSPGSNISFKKTNFAVVINSDLSIFASNLFQKVSLLLTSPLSLVIFNSGSLNLNK